MVDFTNEIEALKMLWDQQYNHFKDVCKRKNDIIADEMFTETSMRGLQMAIDELRKIQGMYPTTPPDTK